MFPVDWDFTAIAEDNNSTEKNEMSYNINDIVICKIKDNKIVEATTKDFDAKISFKIIGKKDYTFSSIEYLIYIPEYELGRIVSEYKVDRRIICECNVDPKFTGDYMDYIRPIHICRLEYVAVGERCTLCKE